MSHKKCVCCGDDFIIPAKSVKRDSHATRTRKLRQKHQDKLNQVTQDMKGKYVEFVTDVAGVLSNRINSVPLPVRAAPDLEEK